MTWWKGVILGVLALGVVALAYQGLKDRPAVATHVTLAKSARGTIVRSIAGAGKIQAGTTVKISSNLSGDLVELAVGSGDQVKKGQVLGRIDPRRFQAASKQMLASQSAAKADQQVAQVEVDRSLAELTRVSGLKQKGLASTAEVEKVKADNDAAQARLASAKEHFAQATAAYEEALTNLSHTTLTAPLDGTIIEIDRLVGERVRGSDFSEDTLMEIAALNVMEVSIEVGEHEIVYLKVGQEADVSVDALEGQSFKGHVVLLAQHATVKNPGTDSEVTSFPVLVAINHRPPSVLPGMSAEVHITAETHKDALTVPIQAVTVRPEKLLPDYRAPVEGSGLSAPKHGESLAKVVFVVDGDNKAHLRRVQTGIASETDVEILEGVKEGERVVEGPFRTLSKELKDGAAVSEGDAEPTGRG